MANTWYAYTGGTSGDPKLAANYSKFNGKPGCLNGSFVCAIYAPDGGLIPTSPLPANILSYIADGLAHLVAEPQIPAGSKKYVYMKN